MTLVVADTGPINYLVLVGAISVLPNLYSRIVLPEEVVSELRSSRAPEPVRDWARVMPAWIEVHRPTRSWPGLRIEESVNGGEAAAISLALELQADRILLDDLEARRVALDSGLKIAGTIRVLEEAAVKGLIDLKEAFTKLQQTNFRIAPVLIKQALARDAARRK